MPDQTSDKTERQLRSAESPEQDLNARARQILSSESNHLLGSLASKNLSLPEKTALHAPHKMSYLESGIDSLSSLVIHDDENRASVNHYGAEFIKTASLFTGGKLGLVASAVSYGLGQACPEDSLKERAYDFTLGAAKGSSMRGMFSLIGRSGAYAPIKGAFMGLSSGAAEEIFKRETFSNPDGLNERLRKNAFNPQAVLFNAALFTAGEGLYSGVNHFYFKGALAENKMLSAGIMGGSFGFVNGTVAEASKEISENGKIDPGRVLFKGFLEANVSALGAMAGMKVSDPVFQAKVKDNTLKALDSLGLSPFRRSREFLVTEGFGQLDQFSNEQSRSALTTVREVRRILGFEKLGPEKHMLFQHSSEKNSSVPIPKLADLLATCNPEKLGPAEKAAHLFPEAKGPVFLERGSENRIRLSVGDQSPQWKNGIGGNRIMLGGRDTTISAMAPLMIGDPNNLDSEGSRKAWGDFLADLSKAKKVGIEGVSTDVWWGIVEAKQGQFKWNYYDKLSSEIINAGLKWVPIQSFHECGGNVGDSVNVPVPFWVWNKIASQIPGSSPDVAKFKSEQGNVSSEYIQFWADKWATPLYKNFMVEFGNHFAAKAKNIAEINISLGPAGEARYPSYNHHDQNVAYPSRGALQSYSDLAKADFKDWVMKKYGDMEGVQKAWGGHVQNVEPPVNAEAFFKDKVHTDTQYGRDYFDWYQGTLINHIKGVMGTAFEVYGPDSAYKDSKIGMKIPGIHWRIGTNQGGNVQLSDRLAELSAGMIRTSSNDWTSDELGRGYRPLLSGIKELMTLPGGNRLQLHFTALEMPDGQDANMGAKAMPYTLGDWVGAEAKRQGIPLKGENALAGTLGSDAAWQIMASHLNLPNHPGFYNGLTLLRLSDAVGGSLQYSNLEKLINAINGAKVIPASAAEQKNAS
ncbi:MAG: family 14 glycosylhydrolase [Candidatus Obscuribacterales bacterium]|nr:family 14 glycosylhydrolase [Candidatus Obscuribacterales bacterium]